MENDNTQSDSALADEKTASRDAAQNFAKDGQKNKPVDKAHEKVYVEVTFRGNKRMYYMVSRGAGIRLQDCVIADVEKGHDIGKVTCSGLLAEAKHGISNGHNIIRKANDQDHTRLAKLETDEKDSFAVCKSKIEYYRLEMNLVDVEKQFDESKITFYFLAEQRVDFRELVKDLAGTFKTRIELRQIGVRDEARRLSGVGVCGRPLCCANHLSNFEQISTQMARTQHLSLNQSKLSGNCGRLKCCLKYELDFYEEMNHVFPQPGTKIKTSKGEAVVTGINVMKEQVKLQYTQTGSEESLSQDDFLVLTGKAPAKAPAPPETPAEAPTPARPAPETAAALDHASPADNEESAMLDDLAETTDEFDDNSDEITLEKDFAPPEPAPSPPGPSES